MDGKVSYSDERVKAVFAKWKELVDGKFYLPNNTTYTWQESLSFLLNGKAAMILIGSFLGQAVPPDMKDKIGFFPFPTIKPDVPAWFYDPTHGLLNALLGIFGVPPFAPLSDPNTVTFAIIAAGLWPQISYCMILFLAGLTAVDPEQIEAGRLDGARGFRMFWHIIMPHLRPATFIAVVITVVGALRSFDLVQVMTDGGPYGSSSLLAFFMFQQSIANFRMGYGAASAVVLFLIMSIFIAFFLWRMIRTEEH